MFLPRRVAIAAVALNLPSAAAQQAALAERSDDWLRVQLGDPLLWRLRQASTLMPASIDERHVLVRANALRLDGS
jgi:hypothetical protein